MEVTGCGNNVYKGNSCEDDGSAGHSGSGKAHRGIWLKGID